MPPHLSPYLLALPILLSAQVAHSQSITSAPDGTGSLIQQTGNQYDITGGLRSQDGTNLFHSFGRFGLNPSETANFLAQPAMQNILGRVVGGEASIIHGRLQITGGNPNLYLINPAGIVFGATASMNVPAAFTATTANAIRFSNGLANGWFNAVGTNDYANLVGSPNAFAFLTAQPGSVLNAGNLAVSPGQTLTLLGGTVVNTGTLTAPGGQIAIAAVPGQTLVRLSQPGHLLSLEFSPLPPTLSPSHSPTLSPSHSPTLSPTPATLPQLLTGGNLSHATGLTVNPDGTLQLTGSTTRIPVAPGTNLISGTLSTALSSPSSPSSPSPHIPPSSITVLGDRVALLSATLDASGNQGGGTIRIGGDYQGKGTLPNANHTFISRDSVINADALQTGNGGQVIVWADKTTQFYGSATARGANVNSPSNGGFVEISGKENLTFQGTVDVSAPTGKPGTVLFDPRDINILVDAGIPGADNAQVADGTILFADGGVDTDFQISFPALSAITGDLVLQATRDINLNRSLDLPGTPGSTITFTAGRNFNGAGQAIVALGRNVTITGANVIIGLINTSASTNGGNGGAITLTATNGSIGTGSLLLSDSLLAGNGNAGNGGNITLIAPNGNISTGTLAARSIVQGDGNAGNAGKVTLSAGGNIDLAAVDARSLLTLSGTGSTGNGGEITLNAGGNINVTGDLLTATGATNGAGGNAGNITLKALNGNINAKILNSSSQLSQGNGIVGNGGTITLDTGGSINLSSIFTRSRLVNNAAGSTGNGGDMSLTATGDITITGSLDSSSSSRNSGNISLQSGKVIATSGYISTSTRSGQAGNVRLIAAGNITTGGDLTQAGCSPGAADYCFGVGANSSQPGSQAADITIRSAAGSINTAKGWIGAGGNGSDANAIRLEAWGDITTSAVFATSGNGNGGNISLISKTGSIDTSQTPGTLTAWGTLNGGTITLDAAKNITLGDGFEFKPFGPVLIVPVYAIDSRSLSALPTDLTRRGTGSGGTINLVSREGSIRSRNVDNSNFSLSITSSGGKDGGNITLNAATEIAINGGLDSSGGVNGKGGNIILDPVEDIQVGFINTQAGTIGGDIDITAGRFLRTTGAFTDRNGILASISAAGGTIGGSVTIRHGGGLLDIPFVVGNATINGTRGAITTGTGNTILPLQSFPGIYIQGNPPNQIRILTPSRSASVTPIPCLISGCKTIPVFEELTNPTQPETKTPKRLEDLRSGLREIQQATGITPAVLYVQFIPTPGLRKIDVAEREDTLTDEFQQYFKRSIAGVNLAIVTEPKQSDQLELLLVTADGEPVRIRVPGTTRLEVFKRARQFYLEVADRSKYRSKSYLTPAKQLYQWLIAPIEPELQKRGIRNLAFILDSGLRTIPLAALHDGKQFLVEKYSLGLMPSFSLTDTRYTDLRQVQVLATGISRFGNLVPLPSVPLEIATISQKLWKGTALMNEAVTLDNLKAERQQRPFGIIHLATHAAFIPEAPQNSFIQLWDTQLRLAQIHQLGWEHPPVELAVLSACQTAVGDAKAELGFAGVAAQAGVKSVLASLWEMDDEATLGLMTEFYQQLKTAPIRAEALRRAQIAMLKGEVRLAEQHLVWSGGKVPLTADMDERYSQTFTHPVYWSGFTMVGSPW